MRLFEAKPAVRQQVPLLLGVVGPSGSGKTFSALRLATGMQRVIGGDIFFIDTEAKRALHYSDKFRFQHVPFDPPFGPLDYLAALEFCVKAGAKIVVVDSMTHEHSGEGGVMDQSEKYLDNKCGDDEKARERNFMLSLKAPKMQRKKLNSRIVQMGINGIFCYRASEKIKPKTGGAPEKLGWQPETTSPLVYEMAQQFLLPPGSDGVPTFRADTQAERMMIKTPEQFRGWFKDGQRLDEDMGERMARWAAGGDAQPAVKPTRAPLPTDGNKAGNSPQKRRMFGAINKLPLGGDAPEEKRDARIAWMRNVCGRDDINSSDDLTDREVAKCIEYAENGETF